MERRYFGIIALVLITATCFAGAAEAANNTTRLPDRGAHVSIANYTRGEVGQLNYSHTIKQYTPTIMSAWFRNVGSLTVFEKMELHIETMTRNITASYFDGFATLLPGESRKFWVNYTHVNDTGYYLLHVNASYNGKTAQAWGIFLVVPYYDVISPTPVTPPTEAGGWSDFNRTQGPGIARLVLNYQNTITLHPGQSYILPITIENRGTASAYDLKVYASGSGVVFDVSPMYIPKIAAGSQGVFLISISVPFNAEPGTYTIDFSVANSEGSQEGRVDVNVVQGGTEREDLASMIENYNYIYTTVKQRLSNIALDGKNISDAFAELQAGYDDLQSAKRSYDAKEYDKTKDFLDKAKKHLENALIMGEYAAIPQMIFYLPGNITFLIILVIALGVVTTYHFFIARRKKHRIDLEKERLKSGG